MKTKREVLKLIAKDGDCTCLSCHDCPYLYKKEGLFCCRSRRELSKVGAMAILRMFPEKKNPILEVGTKIRFNSGDIATISKVDCGNVYYYNLVFGNGHRESFDYLIGKTWEVVE